ncbi:MAG: DUF167 domain-containing protein [Bacillota bacterium]
MLDIKQGDGYVTLKVRVQPKASKNAVVGIFADALKISVTAPPVDNEANRVLCEFVAKHFKLPKSAVTVVGGETSRNKIVAIRNVTVEHIRAALIV